MAPALGILPIIPKWTDYLELNGPHLSYLKIGCFTRSRRKPLALQAESDFFDELRFSKWPDPWLECLVDGTLSIEALEGVSHRLDEFR